MKTALPREHRSILEATVAQARVQAEDGAAKALHALAVGAAAPPAHATATQKKLRVQLRAHGRALGDAAASDGTQATARLVTEIAYEHWHRMLFARFLAESNLLMHPDGYPVSLADCKEDAATLMPPARSEWEVAGRYASAMLPNVFRVDSPVLALVLPLETEQALEALLAKLPATVFQADDSLGWSYQFWQAQKKKLVQQQMKQAGTKVGADELPAVTQLFTEQYMVAFQLENALGAWMHSRHPRMALPVDMPYFRKMTDGGPAAGTFPAWPNTLESFTLLDPCLGSGHFLVSAFHYLVPLRCATEALSVRAAVDRVLADNLFGLELDARCVEIAAFALALVAWRYPDEKGNALGYRALPRLNIACVGVAPRSKKADWLALAEGDRRLEAGMGELYDLFQKAPELGSLIDPKAATQGDLISAQWDELPHKLDLALAAQESGPDDAQDSEAASAVLEARVTARGMVHASRILTRRYHLVMTNPPYLGAGDHGSVLKDFFEEHYASAKSEIANVFLERCLKLCLPGGVVSFVMPQNWLFLKSYQVQREHLLRYSTWNLLVRLGEKGFESKEAAGAFAILLTLTRAKPAADHRMRGLDASAPKSPGEKAVLLVDGDIVEVSQAGQLGNPDARIAFDEVEDLPLLGQYAAGLVGLQTGDDPMFVCGFWEHPELNYDIWEPMQGTPEELTSYAGNSWLVRWEKGQGLLLSLETARPTQGAKAIGRQGVAIHRMRVLFPYHFAGERFHQNVAVIVPKNQEHLTAIWCFCASLEYNQAVRRIDQKLNVTNATLVKVPFDLAHWQQVAAERYPNGLPKPYSDDPTQWIFHGHPQPATDPLQVAVARLLGYRWPAESDAAMELSDEARAWIARCKEPHSLVDDDGILCLPAVRGEAAAVDRLRALLAKAFGADWTPASEAKLLSDAGCEGLPLAQWLRDKFFEQHVDRFKSKKGGGRPFIWHVWDGHKDGFSALLNYHTLTRAKLQTLIHTYLGDWITQQRRTVDAGGAHAGEATLKLAKAEALKGQLEAIAQGEKPFDIFVRWKPLSQQPIGWEPDLNDGVRMNIRPFVEAGVLRIPRAKLGIKWEADRGKDVASAPWFKLGPTYGEPEGTRINDHHLSLAEKQAARQQLSLRAR